MNKRVGMAAVLCFAALLIGSANAENRWKSLDGPYWANGIDVAYGANDELYDHAWYRYLIGSEEANRELFYWREGELKWLPSQIAPVLSANRVISYKLNGSGSRAFCGVINDDIYVTQNGGLEWSHMFFPENLNRQFTSIECINWTDNPGQHVFVASQHVPGLASAYLTTDAGQNWSKLGGTSDPLDNLEVYDIETLPDIGENAFLTAGTSAGIYAHHGDYGAAWEYKAFGDGEVHVIETIDYWDSGKQVAAVTFPGDDRRLYFTANGWDSWREIFLQGDLHFDKEVKDVSAIYWAGAEEPISIYAATTDGFYFLDFDATDDPIYATAYDLKASAPYGYAPLQYDYNAQAVDYILSHGTENDTASIVATTDYNVYEIKEVRSSGNNDIISVEISEAVTGTYISNVVDAGYPVNSGGTQEILAISDNGLIKKQTGLKNWNLVGKAFDPAQTGATGTSIASDYTGPGEDYVLASSNLTNNGTIMRSTNRGQSWDDVTPSNPDVISAVELDPELDSDQAFFAGTASTVFISGDNGANWMPSGNLSDPAFRDVSSDPNPYLEGDAYPAVQETSGRSCMTAVRKLGIP